MKVMVVGSGGREHAISWKVAQSKLRPEVICCPGNAGIARNIRCISPVGPGNDGFLRAAMEERVDLTVVGNEGPIVDGITDLFHSAGMSIFAPVQKGAWMTEGSKAACKIMLRRAGVPTADFAIFSNYQEAEQFIKRLNRPLVVKADLLAAGKGVFVTDSVEETLNAAWKLMVQGACNNAGRTVVLEERLNGEERSFIVVTDGYSAVPLVTAHDYKRVRAGDNRMTGGMGCYAPAPLPHFMRERVMELVVLPVLAELRKCGIVYQGVLYFGLMITAEGIMVLEINCRMGDPESQVILPLLRSDFLELMIMALNSKLADVRVRWNPIHTVGVVVAAPGYPEDPQTGGKISGLDEAEETGAQVFCGAVGRNNGDLIASGGRVVTVVCDSFDPNVAIKRAYRAVDKIQLEDKQVRLDIGQATE